MTRIVSIGLDGAAWHKLDRLIDAGRLPNLAGLARDGARAPLRSVTPPVTCPAWRCSTSGKNPGKVGVFWWLNLDRTSGEITTPDAHAFATADVWDYLSEDGYRCAVLNVPMTYPPSQLDGTMVSGFGAAFDVDDDSSGPITHPPEFERELVAEYDWKTEVEDATTEDGLEEVYDVLRSRFELLLDLLERGYDYVHLTAFYINVLQHKYGDGERTARGWELIDDYLGRIDTDDTLLVLYSDHGHAPVERTFAVNRWLMEEGYLSMNGDSNSTDAVSGELYEALTSVGVSPKRMAVLARRLLPESVHERVIPSTYPIPSSQLADRIEWADNDAVAFSQGPLYLNRDRLGDRYETVRESLIRDLGNLTYDGEPVLSDVRRAEEVYDGPFLDRAPDLLLSSGDGWEIYGGIVPSTFESQAMSWTSGNHPVGMLLLNGPGVEPADLPERSLLDVAPTVLSYLGSPVPSDMDGSPVAEAFEDRELSTRRREPIEVSAGRGLRDDDGVRQHLEDIGYLE